MKKINHFTTHDRINLQAAILKYTSLDIVAINLKKTEKLSEFVLKKTENF